MNGLSQMDRRSRALWQAAAARKREWYTVPLTPWRRSLSVIADVRFVHRTLLSYARSNVPFDEFWWA